MDAFIIPYIIIAILLALNKITLAKYNKAVQYIKYLERGNKDARY